MTRSYDMTERSRKASRTAERIVLATETLLREGPVGDVTLEAVARGAGVSVQTVLRHMGSRLGCLEAVGARVGARVEDQRGRTGPGDIEGALGDLVAHYEAEGRLILHLLAQEAVEPFTQGIATIGRDYHRAWVRRCLGNQGDPQDSETLDALVAATDLYVWKLLRLDLGRSPQEATRIMLRLVHGILEPQ